MTYDRVKGKTQQVQFGEYYFECQNQTMNGDQDYRTPDENSNHTEN